MGGSSRDSEGISQAAEQAAEQDAGDVHLHGVTRAQQRRVSRAAVIGTLLEYYDLGIYAVAAATVFSTVFFPDASPGLAAVQAIATFSVAYFVRPIAAVILGRLGDRIGRRKISVACLVIMGVATLGIGVLPGYATVGWVAPALLVLMRIGQGVGASAEFSGATLMAFEFAPRRRRGLYSSLAGLGASSGGMLASLAMLLVTSNMSQESFQSWGWRVPFLVSGVLVIYGLWLRTNLPETPVFTKIAAENKVAQAPLRELVVKWPRALTAIMLVGIANAAFYMFTAVFLVSYATKDLGYTPGTVLAAMLVSQVVMSAMAPVFGALSDRIGVRAVLGIGMLSGAVLSFVLFDLVRPDATAGLFVAMCLGNGLAAASVSATAGAFGAQLLPARIRFTGTASAREFGSMLGSGVVPLLAAQLAYLGGESTRPLSGLFLVVALLGLLGVLIARPISEVETDPVPASERGDELTASQPMG